MPTKMHAPISLGLHVIHQLDDPVLPQDAATKNYVDANSSGAPEVYVTTTEPPVPWTLWADLSQMEVLA